MTPLERAAKAARERYEQEWLQRENPVYPDGIDEIWLATTRAALETLMEPTEEMLSTACAAIHEKSKEPGWSNTVIVDTAWQAMLQEVLDE